jgi:phage repressor protein C with HTH and peptisase S24 domain
MIGMSADEMRERGFISVPFSEDLRLDAGRGGTIPVTSGADTSPVIVHGPSLRRHTARNLQAFRVGGDSMEPVIAENGIVLADLSVNRPGLIKDGNIYVVCWELQEGICSVKYLSWGEKGRSVVISSQNSAVYESLVKRVDEIQIIGHVIWSWREH